MTWQRAWENPVVLAAFVGAQSSLAVSIVGGVSGAISGYFQARNDAQHNVFGVLTENMKLQDRMDAFIAAGFFDDSNCVIRKAVFHYNSGCKPIGSAKGD